MNLALLIACQTPSSPQHETESTPPIQSVAKKIDASNSVVSEMSAPQSPARTTALIVIDTLRDDALRKVETPNIDRLTEQGHRVEHAWAASTWTVPSVIGLLTGKSVREHGWNLPTGRLGKYPPLPDVPLISEFFRANDIKTLHTDLPTAGAAAEVTGKGGARSRARTRNGESTAVVSVASVVEAARVAISRR